MVSPEPVPSPLAFEVADPVTLEPTEAALEAEDEYEDAVLIWGRKGWLQVGRLCRWAAGHGSPVLCPEPPD